ncbi:PLD nuclease N-terminal domain-containing protein [Granulosicoccus sp. 3-233]|uniref:PLD nuclease N-terminal domain-containing protein n=1 Tax=Granulosicoccus sp. 3-233 TaxID=3417969 RepID=UPI003D34FAB3
MEIGFGGGILGFIIFVLDIYAIIKIVGSTASTLKKLIWVLIVVFLPVVGLIAWFILGPKS